MQSTAPPSLPLRQPPSSARPLRPRSAPAKPRSVPVSPRSVIRDLYTHEQPVYASASPSAAAIDEVISKLSDWDAAFTLATRSIKQLRNAGPLDCPSTIAIAAANAAASAAVAAQRRHDMLRDVLQLVCEPLGVVTAAADRPKEAVPSADAKFRIMSADAQLLKSKVRAAERRASLGEEATE
eukprot:5843239-Prymnesium_polylepis.1